MDYFRVAVVGGGVTGLIVARRLRQRGVAVTLIEAGFPFGGRIGTRSVEIPGYGRAEFDLGCLLFRDHPERPHAAPPGLPAQRFLVDALGAPFPTPMTPVEMVTVDYLGNNHRHPSPFRPRGSTQSLVNHLLPTGIDEHLEVRTLTEVTAITPVIPAEPDWFRWRVRTRHRNEDTDWQAGASVMAHAIVLTQPVPDALALLDQSKFELPDGLRDELTAVRYDPCFVLHVAYRGTRPMLAPIIAIQDGSPLAFIADNRALSVSPIGPALTAQATREWSLANWELTDEEVAAQLLEALNPWVSGVRVWHHLHRWERAFVQSPIHFPFAQITAPPLFLAGDSFAAYAGSGLDTACTSAIHVSDRVCHFLTEIRRDVGGDTKGVRRKLEVAVTSEHDAIEAVRSGADGILLCSALEVGGLTPSADLLIAVRSALASLSRRPNQESVTITVMIRPRAGGFVYSREEFSLMRAEAARLLELGADGIAFGILTRRDDSQAEVRIDFARSRELIEVAHAVGKVAVFNRAFDLLTDRRAGLHDLIQLRCKRVFTSGSHYLALDGMGELEADVQFAGWDIQVVATGGITAGTVGVIICGTGCDHVLGSFRHRVRDPSVPRDHAIADALGLNDGSHAVTDGEHVREAVTVLCRLERQPTEPEEAAEE